MSSLARAATTVGAALILLNSVSLAQRGGQDWTTIGNDAQRSNWLRNDPKISPESMAKPGFEMLWKVKLNNVSRQMNAITQPALLDFYITHRGFRALGFVGGSSDIVTAIDTDLSRVEWETKIGSGTPAAASTVQCPGGMTTSVARITPLPMAPAAAFSRGRSNPPKSDVGEPGEGAVTLKAVRPPPLGAAPGAAANNTKGGRRGATPAAGPFTRGPSYVYALSSDGKMHLMYVTNGAEPKPGVPFLPANAHARGLMVFDGMAYVATVNGCGGVENGIWALDLESEKVTQWKSASGNVVGTEGFAVGPDGTIFVAAGNELVALDSETLAPKGSYKSGGAAFTSSPLVFDFKGRNAIAATTGDGKLHIVEAAGMVLLGSGDAGHGNYDVGALTSWQEVNGARWILVPSATKVVAWKVADKGGMAALEPGWTSRDLVLPIAPAVVNGVVFAVSSGKRGVPAVLYALDGASGKALWNSGKSILSFVTTGSLSAGGSRVYVSTHDGTQYAFGVPIEH